MARTPEAQRRRRAEAAGAAEAPPVFHQAICPVCGVFRSLSYRGRDGERKEGWNLELADHQHFGVTLVAGGRGGLRIAGYFSPGEDVDGYFPRVKKQLLDALRVWLARGWLLPSELRELEAREVPEAIPAPREREVEEVPKVIPAPPPPAPRRPRAYQLPKRPTAPAINRLIAHIRSISELEEEAVEAELERIEGDFADWVETVQEAYEREDQKEEPDEERLALLEERLETLVEVAEALGERDASAVISALERYP